ncbi:phosphotyrosine protein phosphatases I [Artomyces pyxidatus]|uniref:Phosphotyrosine protein phosphatases I n=1 Tax=Artomyces pyxidatus TaxID=48021 RepID=A0ACB8TIT6_9AGAM|nr:phosphotyrosine protein phosphatases I [Artomyces pyxidatus]
MAPKVLIVCLGNICRSPIGEAVLRHVASERGVDLTVDSAGTAGYHVGEEPDERALAVCAKHAVAIDHAARQVNQADFRKFTHILAADEANLRNLLHMQPSDSTAQVKLWGSYADGKPINDPYYGSNKDFQETYRQCLDLSNAFLDDLAKL